MTDLFSQLYKLCSRDGEKSCLEDWLTECIAVVFRSLSNEEWLALIERLSGHSALDLTAVLDGADITVRTQVSADHFGRPDLVIYVGDDPLILFENKVAHTVDQASDASGRVVHQLHRYAEWLSTQERAKGLRHSLVFLTHITAPPADFTISEGENVYFGVHRQVDSWGELTRFLIEITQGSGSNSFSHKLSLSLLEHLECNDMANEFPKTSDFAALELFLRFGPPLENLVTQMWRQVAHAANSSNQSGMSVDPEHEYGRYEASRYVNRTSRTGSTGSFLSTGIWYPEIGTGWDKDDLNGYEARGPHVFLLFADNDDDVFEDIKGVPGQDWLRPSSDFLVLRPLHSFGGDADDRARAMLEWLSGEAKKLRAFLLSENLTT
ncbi:hypothetical protein GGQ97_001558 [Sphingomonas kaistensis]|uniref:PD-(D/E)XK nuclease superfamily protein n=1 Tax=Sphingomonas kaistensis TaxID=298708 RepID=A0A7X6BGS5_9SPHN|nr:PD-(D/E)XK nuclease family protein [Sphingomonas kaistensis]NJC05765.1 hypothetical protein [Sphingomonas kaistensis]